MTISAPMAEYSTIQLIREKVAPFRMFMKYKEMIRNYEIIKHHD